MADSAYGYFENSIHMVENALKTIDKAVFDRLMENCAETLKNKKKIVVSGLGKNVPVCEKFVSTMISLGLDASFLHTNSALHGEIGMIHQGDLVIVLSKSGSTDESVKLVEALRNRNGIQLWLLTFNPEGALMKSIDNKLLICLEHEGDLWDIIPNNSTTINLIILQTIAVELSKKLNLTLEKDFKPNHPGGAIGEKLYNGR